MKELEEHFKKISLDKEPANLYNPIYYTLSQGGKRLRPRLVMMSTKFFGGDEAAAIHPAAAFEMLHNFTLIHDDIMDNAPIRRGQPTVYRHWNSNIAILSGDALATLALREMLHTPTRSETVVALTDLLAQTSIEICEGQQKDLDFETAENVAIDDYIWMIQYKTAVMLAGCLKAGALLSHATASDCEAIYQYGIYLGLAFQLKDDLLDVYGDTAVFGKPIGGDIRENKKTYLYLRALQDADTDDKKKLLHYFSSTDFDDKEKFEAVTKIYKHLDIQKKTEEKIEEYAQLALAELGKISAGSEEGRQEFIHLANELSKRIK